MNLLYWPLCLILTWSLSQNMFYNISQICVCHWKSLGVFGSCQLIMPGWSHLRDDKTDTVLLQVHLGTWAKNLQQLRISVDNQGRAWKYKLQAYLHWQQAWECWKQSWTWQWKAWKHQKTQRTSLRAPQITLKQCGNRIIFFGITVGSTGNCNYWISFNSVWNWSIRFILSSIYLNITIKV